MSNLTVRGNPLGTGTFTVESPNSNNSRTITLPDATTTLVGTDAAQTLTNKTINGGALTLMTAQASTSGTSIDFTGIPSWAKRVTVMLRNVSTNGTSIIQVQLGTSGGIVSTGYAVSGGGMAGTVATTNYASGFAISDSNAATNTFDGSISLSNLTGNDWVGFGWFRRNAGSSAVSVGGVTLSGTLDRVRITSANGTDTFDAGTINIMYEG